MIDLFTYIAFVASVAILSITAAPTIGAFPAYALATTVVLTSHVMESDTTNVQSMVESGFDYVPAADKVYNVD